MDFRDYLDLNDADGPKIVGHRIWLFNVLYEHLYNGRRADQIVECFPSLTMETVYASLLYFEQNKPACRQMVDEEIERRERVRQDERAAHPDRYESLRQRLADRPHKHI